MGKPAGKSFYTECNRHNHKRGDSTISVLNGETVKAKIISSIADHLLLHYVPTATLKKMGKADLAAHLTSKLPTSKTAKSGDIGEILAVEYVNGGFLPYSVPIYRLSYKDGRNLALRGEDAIGINWQSKPIGFLKVEAKSRKSLQTTVVRNARKSLDRNKGLPTSFTLGFIIDRLFDENKDILAKQLTPYIGQRLPKSSQVAHLIFTFSESDPTSAFTEAAKALRTPRARYFIGLYVSEHQKVIAQIYRRARSD